MDERLAGLAGRWRAEAEAIATGLTEWRAQHPRATFAEIEAALDARLDGMRARLLEDLALASRATEAGGAGAAGGARVARAAGGHAGGPGGAAAAGVRDVLGLRGRAFPPWMRSWRCCRGG